MDRREELRNQLQALKLDLERDFHASRLGRFGSVGRDERSRSPRNV